MNEKKQKIEDSFIPSFIDSNGTIQYKYMEVNCMFFCEVFPEDCPAIPAGLEENVKTWGKKVKACIEKRAVKVLS